MAHLDHSTLRRHPGLNASVKIAIVGIGGIFPGAADPDQLWMHILAGRALTRQVPQGRWPLALADVYAAELAPDKVYSQRGCYIENFTFDPTGLRLDADLLNRLDPMFHLLLHAGRMAWRDAKTSPIDPHRAGIIIGNIALPTAAASALTEEILGPILAAQVLGRTEAPAGHRTEPLNRYVAGLPAGLLARALGLGGGSYTLDAACASSLYALKLAADELQAGRADLMLTGGLSRPDCLYTQMGFSQLHALSPTGRCAPFDAGSDGLVVGEGAGILALKRLDDALRDGDHIYATIAGVGLSNDIAGNLMLPDSGGQLRALLAAYAQAGWTPTDLDLIECHGTGTPVGDAVEFTSLQTLWKEGSHPQSSHTADSKRCVIGSVKSNVGHLLTAAGAAGLIKVLLAMRHQTLPPTANFTAPPSGIALHESPFAVLREPTAWPRRAANPRRAGISAFGFGGINAHVLLEEWEAPTTTSTSRRSHPVAPDESLGLEVQALTIQNEPSVLTKTNTHIPPAIAIVGIGAHFGPWKTLQAFTHRIFDQDHTPPTTPTRWWGFAAAQHFRGYLLDEIVIPIGRFRIPPAELTDMLPQQLLMLQVAADAFDDAHLGLTDSTGERLDTGVFIGIGLDLNTTNYHFRWTLLEKARRWSRELGLNLSPAEIAAWVRDLRHAAGPALNANRTMGALGGIVASRIARAFHIGGTSFTVSSEETSSLHALEVALRALQRHELNIALVGGIDLAGDLRAVLGQHAGRPYSPSGIALPLDAAADGTIIGEGAAALVLKRHADALRDGDRIYALIRGLGSATETTPGPFSLIPSTQTYRTSLERACTDAQLPQDPLPFNYIETHGSGTAAEDAIEATALSALFQDHPTTLPCALGSVKTAIGHTGAAAGLASLVKTALCLHHEILPPLSTHHTLRPPLATLNGSVFIPTTPQYWIQDRAAGPRRAVVSAMSIGGNCVHVILESAPQAGGTPALRNAGEGGAPAVGPTETSPPTHPSLCLALHPPGVPTEALFIASASDTPNLLSTLTQMQHLAENAQQTNIETLAHAWCTQHPPAPNNRHTVSFIAENPAQLQSLINTALQAVKNGQPLATDRTFYHPTPSGLNGQLAFIFPGAGNHFAGMGRELATRWPQILRRLDAENQHLASQFANGRFWSNQPLENLSQRDVIFGHVWLGTMISDLLAACGIKPQAVIGYSLGETTSLFATRTWGTTTRDQMLARMQTSTLFTTDLAGPCNAARQAWNLPAHEPVDWVIGVIDRPATIVRQALAGRQRVYLLIVNTPNECVIGGHRPAVEALVRALACLFILVPGVTTVHCPVAESVATAYRDLHLLDTTPPSDIRFYSCALGQSYKVTRTSAADSIVRQAVAPFDFTQLIRNAYRDGIRLFVEIGPGNSCTRMIDQTLQNQPHLARTACAPGSDAIGTLLRLLAHLASEGIPLDLNFLYPQAVPSGADALVGIGAKTDPSPRNVITVRPGGAAFQVPPTPVSRTPRPAAPASKTLSAALPQPSSIPGDAVITPQLLIEQMAATQIAHAQAQEAFLRLAQQNATALGEVLALQMSLLAAPRAQIAESYFAVLPPEYPPETTPASPSRSIVLDRAQCLEFAIGSLAKVLGPAFAATDTYPTRVRLPDEPLMLVDRIVSIHGTPGSMTSGRVVTEHDVQPGAWYLDSNRIPTCIAVEAGQADLFLSGYLGIDNITQGQAVYRLLDAAVTFHGPLPTPGQTIVYDIAIEHFFRQGQTYLFRFHFDATVNGQPFLTMQKGCAGFFTKAELAAGQGIIQTALDKRLLPGKRPTDWIDPVPLAVESYDDTQVSALRRGDLAACFGPAFANLLQPVGLPTGRMTLVHRILKLDPTAGRYGLGQITGEADIHPDDWFLTCHFVDDRVMPGTLMYECCLHTLRIYLLRMGWVGNQDQIAYEPIPECASQLKCRGQVTASTKKVQYEVTLKELGYTPDGTPFALADALMYADGRPIVQMLDMSVQLSGLTRPQIEQLWSARGGTDVGIRGGAMPSGGWGPPAVHVVPEPNAYDHRPAIFDTDRITAFALGKPSDAFGDRYQVFDRDRKIARLPGPPFQFLDRITAIRDCQPWQLAAGGTIEAQYDVPLDAWYFSINSNATDPIEMPFAVLLEIALQPCGWLAAYLGSALVSDVDMRFRNLGGTATQLRPILPDAGTLTTTVKITNVSHSGGMIIQHFDMAVRHRHGEIYRGNTYFGFFSKESLAHQVGIRDAALYHPTPDELARGTAFSCPVHDPFPTRTMRMVDQIDFFDPAGGPQQLGFIRGTTKVDPAAWFFKAHFFEDPVWPGSLGLESFLQLLKVFAYRRWGSGKDTPTGSGGWGLGSDGASFQTLARNVKHSWIYRGQIIPTDRQVTVEAVITQIDDTRRLIRANGFLTIDGRVIYQMTDFAITMAGFR